MVSSNVKFELNGKVLVVGTAIIFKQRDFDNDLFTCYPINCTDLQGMSTNNSPCLVKHHAIPISCIFLFIINNGCEHIYHQYLLG